MKPSTLRVAHRHLTAKTYMRIAMFDFDGTLFRSWEKTPEWWADTTPYSFFVKPESLGEPCVPDNPDSSYWISKPLTAARVASRDRSTLLVVITGRVKIHKPRVRELLSSVGVKPDAMYFNPGMSAAAFKVAILRNLLAGYNTVGQVTVWENENMKTYEAALVKAGQALGIDLQVDVNRVDARPKPLTCDISDFRVTESLVAGVSNRWLSRSRDVEAAGMSPLELQRLAVRIEKLQQQSSRTRGWQGGDDLSFKNMLPGGRGRQTLPDPKRLRDLADSYPVEGDDKRWLQQNWRNWITWAMRMEGFIRDNDPRNPKRMIRDMVRGKPPGGWR